MNISGEIYNHLSAQLVPKKRNTTHKASELKDVYKSMAKYNKNSPLYLLSLSDEKQSFMINIKEAALTLKDAADAFGNVDSDMYSKKILNSDDSESISGNIKGNNIDGLPEKLSIKLDNLASEQVNVGNYLDSFDLNFVPKQHSFAISSVDGSFTFNMRITEDDTNLSVQRNIADSINSRKLGIQASVLREGDTSALMLSSEDTGVPDTADGLFFTAKQMSSGQNTVDVLGLNNVDVQPFNAQFTINGEQHESASNHISINKVVELDFHKPTTKPVNISFVSDAEQVMEQLDGFVEAYNSLVDLAAAEGETRVGTRNLGNDISSIVSRHKAELESNGLHIDDNGKMVKDISILKDSIKNGGFTELFKDISAFKGDVTKATDRLSIDPLAYVDKLIVTYPNKANKANTPYTQSLYSGLIYNNYA